MHQKWKKLYDINDKIEQESFWIEKKKQQQQNHTVDMR